ncbi:TPA: hypothetical protein U2J55_000139 [Providencia rettgeri]|nr:hypothetical protein [Providencia rettgeri]
MNDIAPENIENTAKSNNLQVINEKVTFWNRVNNAFYVILLFGIGLPILLYWFIPNYNYKYINGILFIAIVTALIHSLYMYAKYGVKFAFLFKYTSEDFPVTTSENTKEQSANKDDSDKNHNQKTEDSKKEELLSYSLIKKEILNSNKELLSNEIVGNISNVYKIEEAFQVINNTTSRMEWAIKNNRINSLINIFIALVITALSSVIILTPIQNIYKAVDSSGSFFDLFDFTEKIENKEEWNLKIENIYDLFIFYAPKISILLFFISLVFFFLNLYKNTNNDVRFFQNELTNIETKAIALKIALITNDLASLSEIMKSLIQTERNITLKNGESTVEIERKKIEEKAQNNMLDKVIKIIEKR